MSKEQEKRPAPRTLEQVTEHAVNVLLRDGTHIPTLIIEGIRDSAVITMPDIADTHEGRLEQMARAGFITARRREVGRLRQIFFITEAWMSTAEQGKVPEQPPSKDPKRKEILMVAQFQAATSKSGVAIIEMRRDAQGKLIDLQPLEQPNGEEVTAESPLLLAFMTGYEIGSLR